MLQVEERFMLREMHRQGVSISEIARRTGYDRKTIRNAVTRPLTLSPVVRKPRRRKLDPYVAYLEQRVALGVLNARKLYQEIQALGYPGKESQVRNFVQGLRPPKPSQATVRFETAPGEQAQVDWAHFGYIEHQGRRQRLYAFIMTLGWSRTSYLEFTVSADIAWWLRCHQHAFAYFGGIPQEMLHDNLKTAVLSRSADGGVHWHPRYLDFADYYGFRPRACQPYRAQTKGKVENGVRYVRGNFWPGLVFTTLADLNQQARSWLDSVANTRLHGTTGAVPFVRLPEEQLMPLAGKPVYDTSLITHRRSSRDCLVSYGGSFYSVPAAYACRLLTLRVTEQDELHILDADGWQVAHHRLAEAAGRRVVVAAHYADLLPHSRRNREATAVQVSRLPPLPPLPDAPAVEVRPLSVYQQWLEVSA